MRRLTLLTICKDHLYVKNSQRKIINRSDSANACSHVVLLLNVHTLP